MEQLSAGGPPDPPAATPALRRRSRPLRPGRLVRGARRRPAPDRHLSRHGRPPPDRGPSVTEARAAAGPGRSRLARPVRLRVRATRPAEAIRSDRRASLRRRSRPLPTVAAERGAPAAGPRPPGAVPAVPGRQPPAGEAL